MIPQPVPLDFGGHRLLIRPLRLRQLAQLQAWLAASWPCPLDVASDEIARAEGDARRRLLVATFEACESWPILLGSALGDRLLDSDGGRVFVLTVATAEFNGWLAPADLPAIAAAATDAEWGRLLRACYGSGPMGVVARLIDPLAFSRTANDEPTDWNLIIAEACGSHDWTPAEVAEMTPGQLGWINRKGKPADIDCPPRPGESADEAAIRRQAYFNLEDKGSNDGNG